VERNIKLSIEYQCPQCGAPAELTENDRIFSCAYCRVRSYLMPPGYFRYLLPHHAAETRELIYFPYWRIKGLLFSCVKNRIDGRFVDTSQQAVKSGYFPFSAGIRPQVDKLTFATRKSPGRFLRSDISLDGAVDRFKDSQARFVPKPIYHQAYIGDVVSLLYAPFYVADGRLYNAALNQPLTRGSRIPEDLAAMLETTRTIDNETRFFPTICPGCGWDMSGEKDAVVLLCPNCQTAWEPTLKGYKKRSFVSLVDVGARGTHLPFWRITADVDGAALNTVADFIRMANLTRPPKDSGTDSRFHFWVPAFKVQPKMFINLLRRLTAVQFQADDGERQLPRETMIPVNLPVSEAIQTLKIVFADFARPKWRVFPQLAQIRFTVRESLLVYIPFNDGHHDLIQPQLTLGIPKSLFKLAENL